jgi:hypothetical protein
MTETSQWVHDTPRGGHAPVPTPNEVKEALQDLDEFLAELPATGLFGAFVLASLAIVCHRWARGRGEGARAVAPHSSGRRSLAVSLLRRADIRR